ncbi:hypothetical protein DFH07DRAFT_772035 [Mycena maculata]|uniref:Uncharacterized protein n=1 Tax=Mycena maculata TaxID=230809 RepID=A0AAD7NH75_9AGAR|nr:hypothetical protein DFH07DRAFT_772035 [Mycena maculata]
MPTNLSYSVTTSSLSNEMSVFDAKIPALTAAEDKALKREAIRNGGKAATPLLKSWLHYYATPSTTPARGPEYHARKRDELRARVAARQARVKALMDLRRRAVEASVRRWPRPPCHPHGKGNLQRDEIRRREQEARQRDKAVMEECATAAHIEHLMALRTRAYDFPTPMLDLDVYTQIALLADLPTLLSLTRAHRDLDQLPQTSGYLPWYTYYHCLFVNACSPPRKIKSLIFEDTRIDVRVPEQQWSFVMLHMPNLKHLLVTQYIPLAPDIIPHLPFSLAFFGSRCRVVRAWGDLIASQTDLEELALDSDLFVAVPTLPQLRTVKARPADVARLAQYHELVHVWLWSGTPLSGDADLKRADLEHFSASPSRLVTIRLGSEQLLLLLNAAPALLPTVQHIALDEDDEWFWFGLRPKAVTEMVLGVGAALDDRFPNLKSLTLVSDTYPDRRHMADVGRRLIAEKGMPSAAHYLRILTVTMAGLVFSRVLAPLCTAPLLSTFHFCAHDGCITFTNWRCVDEEFDWAEFSAHAPWDFDPAYTS